MYYPRLFLLVLLLNLFNALTCVSSGDTPYESASPGTLPATPFDRTPSDSNTPRRSQHPPANAHSRVVYEDEDPLLSRLSWLKGREDQARSRGRFKYVESRMQYPTDIIPGPLSDVSPAESGSRVSGEDGPSERGGAVGESGKANLGVMVERYPGNFAEESSGKVASPPRARTTLNEGDSRRAFSSLRGHESAPPSAPPLPPHLESDGRDSPTQYALDKAATKLERFHLDQSGAAHPYPHSQSPSPPLTPLTPSPRAEYVAPYRLWSVKSALPTINLPGITRLTDRYPPDYRHFQSTLSALSSHEWTSQLSSRLEWAASHRVDASRPARVMTPFGALTGGEIATGSPSFLYDARDPPPRLDSVMLTGTQKRVKAWKELAGMVPPALTGHSMNVWQSHRAAEYARVDKASQDALHPIQYVGQMLRDRNGAVVLENSIHDELQRGGVPQEALEKLQTKREKEARRKQPAPSLHKAADNVASVKPKQRQSAVDELLGTEYATHNKFWYPYYHTKPAFKLRNPLDTPLEHFPSFAPFADAVALKKV